MSTNNCQKVPAALCAIFLGAFGVHKFILGYNNAGIIMLLISLLGGAFTCGASTGIMGVIALVEGIIYLTMDDEKFIATYQDNQKEWF